MRRIVKAWLRNSAGILLIILGIIAGPIPIVQGWVFVVLGISVIEHPWKHRLHAWLAQRFQLYRRVSLAYFRVRRKFKERHRRKQLQRESSKL